MLIVKGLCFLVFMAQGTWGCSPTPVPPGGNGSYKVGGSIREKDVVGLLFSAIDQNRNGVVDFDEWEQASMPGNNEDFGQLLDAFDTNGDSVFSKNEFRGVYEEWMAGNLSEPHPANV